MDYEPVISGIVAAILAFFALGSAPSVLPVKMIHSVYFFIGRVISFVGNSRIGPKYETLETASLLRMKSAIDGLRAGLTADNKPGDGQPVGLTNEV